MIMIQNYYLILGLGPNLLIVFGTLGPKLLIDFGTLAPKLLIDFGTWPKITNGFWDYRPKFTN